MESATDKRRTFCPHCSQNISYSAYFAHKARYFDSQKSQWMQNELQSDGVEHEGFQSCLVQTGGDFQSPMEQSPDCIIDDNSCSDL